ncbi:MAG: hypothetical protein ABI892_02895 [Flavobacterium sp.]
MKQFALALMGGKILFLASLAGKRLEGIAGIAPENSNNNVSNCKIIHPKVNYENLRRNYITDNSCFLRNFGITLFLLSTSKFFDHARCKNK